jgi:hypothetical protein
MVKFTAKGLLLSLYLIISFIGAYSFQSNPNFMKKIDEYSYFIKELGLSGMFLYVIVSGLIMALAIPLQFLDIVVGMIYPIQEAILLLIA